MAHKRIRFGRDEKGRPRLPMTVDIEEDMRLQDRAMVWDVHFNLGGVSSPGDFKTEEEARQAAAKILRELADEMDPPKCKRCGGRKIVSCLSNPETCPHGQGMDCPHGTHRPCPDCSSGKG